MPELLPHHQKKPSRAYKARSWCATVHGLPSQTSQTVAALIEGRNSKKKPKNAPKLQQETPLVLIQTRKQRNSNTCSVKKGNGRLCQCCTIFSALQGFFQRSCGACHMRFTTLRFCFRYVARYLGRGKLLNLPWHLSSTTVSLLTCRRPTS